MNLKLQKTVCYNPQTKAKGYRTTVKSNGKADMDSLAELAANNTTLHKAEVKMAFEVMLDAIKKNLTEGNRVELKGIGVIGFSCSGDWTATEEEQKAAEHEIGVAFYPTEEIRLAVASAKTSWVKETADDDESESANTDSGNSSTTPTNPGSLED